MKSAVLPALALALLSSACSKVPQEPANNPPKTAATEPAPATYNYRCQSGEIIVVTYPSTDTGNVQYKGKTLEMKIAVSGSGSRYTGGGLEWWSKGSGAGAESMLSRHLADGTTGDSVEVCAES